MEIRKCLTVILWKTAAGAPNSKILLLKVKPRRGAFWQPVTGHVEEGEDYQAAALREAEEETGFRFERTPQFLGLEYQFPGRFGSVRERAFALWVYGPTPPTPVLDAREHDAFQWTTPEEARKLVRFASNEAAIARASQPLAPFLLGKNGAWYQEGEEITHERTAELLHRSLARTPSGQYLIRQGTEEAEVVVEDTPRFVRSFMPESGEILLSTGEREKLRPESISVSSEHILYCELENGWKAKFLRPAYYALTKELRETEDSTKYILHLFGRDHEIRIPH